MSHEQYYDPIWSWKIIFQEERKEIQTVLDDMIGDPNGGFGRLDLPLVC